MSFVTKYLVNQEWDLNAHCVRERANLVHGTGHCIVKRYRNLREGLFES
jgi:hypothetical protein